MVSAMKADLDSINRITREVHIIQIAQGKSMDDEVWIMSDGRAYLVGLHGNSDRVSMAGKQPDNEDLQVRGLNFPYSFLWH
jgi:hypothetical protein